eukprot:m.64064 g.64064  ORF g.64064 m.64064 type:complete len:126 (-) comp9697_c0_seq2:104-481(-)
MVRLPPPTPSFSRVVAAFWAAPATASAIASIAIALGQQLQMQRDLRPQHSELMAILKIRLTQSIVKDRTEPDDAAVLGWHHAMEVAGGGAAIVMGITWHLSHAEELHHGSRARGSKDAAGRPGRS